MDFLGLFSGARAKLPQNIKDASAASADQNPLQAGINVDGGFWQFFQNFLNTSDAPVQKGTLDVANLNLSNIQLNPAADFADEMMVQQFQELAKQFPGELSGDARIAIQKIQGKVAFPEHDTKQFYTLRELSDAVSMAKNAADGDTFSENVFDDLSKALQPVLAQLNNTRAAQTPDGNIQEGASSSGDLPQIQEGASTRGADMAHAADAEEHTLQVRPVLVASKRGEYPEMPAKAIPALQVKAKDTVYLVTTLADQKSVDVEIAGLPAYEQENTNVVQIVLPSTEVEHVLPTDDAIPTNTEQNGVTRSESDETTGIADPIPRISSERTEFSVQDTAMENEPVDEIKKAVPEIPLQKINEQPPTDPVKPVDDESGVATRAADREIRDERLVVQKTPQNVSAGKTFERTTTTDVKQETVVKLTDSIQVESENETAELHTAKRFAIQQTQGDDVHKKAELPQLLNVRILKIKTDEPQKINQHAWYKTENIQLPERSEVHQTQAGLLLNKTTLAWQQALNESLQNQNGFGTPQENKNGQEHLNLVKKAVEKYTDGEANTSQNSAATPTKQVDSENISRDQIFAASKTDIKVETSHLLKPNQVAKQGMTSQLERVQSFEAIRSQIAAAVRNGESEIHIQLKPENLGAMRLMMTLKDGLLNANFLVESNEVKTLLEKNMNSLRETLAERGIKAQSVEIQAQQHVVQSNRTENQEQRAPRDAPEDRRDPQDNQQRKQQRNRDESRQKRFDQYL